MWKTIARVAAIVAAAGLTPALADPDTEAFQDRRNARL